MPVHSRATISARRPWQRGGYLAMAILLAALAPFALGCQSGGSGGSVVTVSSPAATGAATGTGAAAPAVAAGTTTRELTVSGQTRRYRLHLPAGYTPGKPAPLVLNLHGLGESATQQELLSGMSRAADANGFIVVYPEGVGSPQLWNVGPGEEGKQDLAFLRALLDGLDKELTLDPRRMYATGISNGGGMVNRLGCELADRIAAIAPVSGDYQRYQDCAPGRPVPVIAFHGTADPLIPYGGNGLGLPPIRTWAAAWAARNGCDPTPAQTGPARTVHEDSWENCSARATVSLYTIEGGGHTWPGAGANIRKRPQPADAVNATDLMWAFFLAHPRP